jgi:organic radical activating enzyme
MFNEKILCLGNNTKDTDVKTANLANANNAVNYGLVVDPSIIPSHGYYHTSITDIPPADIIRLSERFDKIVLHDQPQNNWDHWKPFLATFKLMIELEKLGRNVDYKNNKSTRGINSIYQTLLTNKSFCIYPWTLLLEHYGMVPLCPKSTVPIRNTIGEITDWQTDTEFMKIRNKMLAGELLPDHCHKACYSQEDEGIVSTRIFETLDWACKLNLQSVEDLKKFTNPTYYEVRQGNKCNLQCRTCIPEHSDLIDKEYKNIGIVFPMQEFKYSNFDHINIDALEPTTRVYATGGEPTLFPGFYEFMQKCIDRGRTDFEFCLGYNGQKLSNKLLELSSHFSDMNFSVSIDGYDIVNDYARWGSDFNTIIKNAKTLIAEGHKVTPETVPSIYNVTNLDKLFEFYDQEFPGSAVFLQVAVSPDDMLSPFNHPNAEMAAESLRRCTQTKAYYTDARGQKSIIDTLLAHYTSNTKFDRDKLIKFFEFNDKLDQSRNVRLVDYIPELEDARRFII